MVSSHVALCHQVEIVQPPGNARSGSTSPRKVHWDGQQGQGAFQEPQGSDPKGPYRSIMVGQSHWVSLHLSMSLLLLSQLVDEGMLLAPAQPRVW